MNIADQLTGVENNFLESNSVFTGFSRNYSRRSHLSTCHFVNLSVQFRHQHLGREKVVEISCLQISVVFLANTVKSSVSVGNLRIKLTAFT